MMFHISIMALVERGVGDAHQIDFQAFIHDKICNWPRCIHPEVVQVEEHFYLCTYNLSIGPATNILIQSKNSTGKPSIQMSSKFYSVSCTV